MRNPGWAGPASGTVLIAVALAVTACGTGSASSAGGAYGSGTQTTQTTQATQAPAAPAYPSSVMTAALKTETTRAGTVLANSHGLTLYYYSADKRGSGTSVCTGGCATAWPPLAAPVKAPAGVRLPGKLGVITRPNGVKQVTLKGYPLYFYIGDKAPGQVKGNGIGRAWHVIKIKA
jgi:predicted lipoprotein with Yx(FWY)xxD motif